MPENGLHADAPSLGGGVYTVPDAARILHLPLPRVGRWVSGYWRLLEGSGRVRSPGVLDAGVWGDGTERALNFLGLVELFTFAALRNLGVSGQKIRRARVELLARSETRYPFASYRFLSDGNRIMVLLDDLPSERMLILGEHGQLGLREVLEPFCQKIDFCEETELASRFWPLGKDRAVVVDPRHGFGRPTLGGTNITVEAVADLVLAGETPSSVGQMYDVPVQSVEDAVEFYGRRAA